MKTLLVRILFAALACAASTSPARAVTDTAIFAGGCFWCVESDFDAVQGVISTTSGYMGGHVANPSYEQVAGKHTGHAEVVEVTFDPEKVSYAQLVEFFWRSIDPTTKDRQFCDTGSPYRSAIFVRGPEQRAVAEASRAELEKSKPFKDAIVTEIVEAAPFYPAEDYHQDYYRKNPLRYNYYRYGCGRDARVQELWGRSVGH